MIEMNMTFTMSESLMEFSDSTQAFQDKESWKAMLWLSHIYSQWKMDM
jgi:hypothetical protein